jgi:hypothetical protein
VSWPVRRCTFPDDAHLKEAGQSVVADQLEAFMRGENFLR